MNKLWLSPQDPGWRELRLARLYRGLRFARLARDRTAVAIIIREIRRVRLPKN